MNPYQFYQMLMKPENRNVSKMVLGVLLTVSLLLPYLTVFILNNFVEADTEVQYEAVLNQNADPITKWEQGQTVERRINVSNRPEGTTEGYGNVYARVQLREYLETGTANVTKSEERLLMGSDGKFLSYDTEEEAREAYPNREVKDYTAVGETTAKWYVVAGDGITGQYLPTSVSVSSPTKVPSSATKGTPSSYAVHKWANPSTDTTAIGEHVSLGLENPVAKAFKGKMPGAVVEVPGHPYKWKVLHVDGSGNMLVVTDKETAIVNGSVGINTSPTWTYEGSALDKNMQAFYKGTLKNKDNVEIGLTKDWWDIARPVNISAIEKEQITFSSDRPTQAGLDKTASSKGLSRVASGSNSTIGEATVTGATCFALSVTEVMMYLGPTEGTVADTDRVGNVAAGSSYGTVGSADIWWLRSRGYSSTDASNVRISGSVTGSIGALNSLGLRPALWINPNADGSVQNLTDAFQNMSDWDGTATASWILDTSSEEGWAYWGQPLEPGQTTGDLLSAVTLKNKPDGAFYYALDGKMEAVSGDSLWSDVPDKVKGKITIATSPTAGVTKVEPGGTLNFTATVTGITSGKDVTWSVEGATPVQEGTEIDKDSGKLKVSSTEPIGNVLTVTATSLDGVVKGTATVTVASPNAAVDAFKDAVVGGAAIEYPAGSGRKWLVVKVSGTYKLIITEANQGSNSQFRTVTPYAPGYSGSVLDGRMQSFYDTLDNDLQDIAMWVDLPAETAPTDWASTKVSTPKTASPNTGTSRTTTKTCFALSYKEASDWSGRNNSTIWWLRSAGSAVGHAAYVKSDGSLSSSSVLSTYDVRPALWINP